LRLLDTGVVINSSKNFGNGSTELLIALARKRLMIAGGKQALMLINSSFSKFCISHRYFHWLIQANSFFTNAKESGKAVLRPCMFQDGTLFVELPVK